MNAAEICSLALGLLGKPGIADLGEDTPLARACKAVYTPVRDGVLEDRNWSFARRQYILDPHTDLPLFGWGKKFQIPAEVVKVHRVDDGSGEHRIPWEVHGRFILADVEKVYVTAVTKQDDTSEYSPNFCLAVATRLAAKLCMPLTENATRSTQLWEEYKVEIREAAGTDGSQGKAERIRSDFLSRRR